MNSMDLLKAFNDIKEEYLIEKECIKNKKKRTNKLIDFIDYVRNLNFKLKLCPCMIFLFMISLCIINKYGYFSGNIIQKQYQIGKKIEDDIIINDCILDETYIDINGDFVNEDLIKKFNLYNKLNISNEFIIKMQGERNEKIMLEDGKFEKYKKFSIRYAKSIEDSKDYININFSKDTLAVYVLNEKNGKIENAKDSIINNLKIKIFELEILNEEGKIKGDACFKCNDYNIHIQVRGITNEEFIDLIKSVIDAFNEVN